MPTKPSTDRRRGLPRPQLDWAIFMDVDGVLIEIAATPDQVVASPQMVDAVGAVSRALDGAVALVSGRPLAELDALMKPLRLPAAGLHGLESRAPSGEITRDGRQAERLDRIRQEMKAFAKAHPGAAVEDKKLAIALHYRGAPDLGGAVIKLAKDLIADHDHDLGLVPGKMVVEIKAKSANKGTAVEAFMAQPPFRGRIPVFVGDDYTDEDGFRAVNRLGGLAIRVGPPPPDVAQTEAQWECDSVRELVAWLEGFASAEQQGTAEDV